MGKFKTLLLAVTGTTISVLTLRSLRNRAATDLADDEPVEEVAEAKEDIDEARADVEEVAEDVDNAKDETIIALKHTGSAVKHATFAAVKAIKSRRKPAETTAHITDPAEAAAEEAGSN